MKLIHHLKTLALAVGAVIAVTALTGAAEQPAAPMPDLAEPRTIAVGAITSGSTPVVGAAVTGRLWPTRRR
jgi:hypothetical protein